MTSCTGVLCYAGVWLLGEGMHVNVVLRRDVWFVEGVTILGTRTESIHFTKVSTRLIDIFEDVIRYFDDCR